jgi:hypothetical protein
LERWINAAKNAELCANERFAITTTRKNIYRLLRKQSEWRPTFSLLAVVEQFAEFDKIVLSYYIKSL